GRPGLATSYDNTDTQVWAVTNQWEDTSTTAAKKAGVSWDANSGLNWDQKYHLWVSSMERTAGYNTYYDTFTFKTPWGKTLPAPKLECAEVAIFLRITFASWYNLPFYLEAIDGERARIFFGHFGARTITDRYKNTPLYRTAYSDHTTAMASHDNDYIVANWPADSKLRTKGLYGGGDEQEFLGDDLLSGAYFDEIFLNKRVGHFLLLTLTYFGSMHMADSRNTYNLVPDAIQPGDLLVERWQRTGIGHVMVVKSAEELPDNQVEATIVSGSMPRRQPKWETPVASKDYFTSEECGGEGTNYDGDEYVKLGGGLKRWRVAKNVNGNWMNSWMNSDEASWICDTDWERLKVRPATFESLLGEVDPVAKREAILIQIEDARNHLRNYPASCSARERREKAFTKLYEVNAEHFSMDKLATDQEYRTKEDYIFAELVYTQSKTCCWNSSTAAMYQIVMDYNNALQEEAQQCIDPVVFMNAEGYGVFQAYAEETGRGGLWKPWTADESCPQANVTSDTQKDHEWSAYCDVFDTSTPVEPTCTDDALEDNDNPAQARALQDDHLIDLKICPSDDDWYSLEIASARTALSITFVHTNGDLDLSLHDSAGTEISSSTSISDTESVDLSALSSGTYLIRVYGYNGAENSYNLTIE
ncbi:PPC domain-containing protein, partial [Myxococcota bacterium]|nr:PPC domain-containing protein [Myxococcota bacterium]